MNGKNFTLGELAGYIHAEVVGNPDCKISGIASLPSAQPGHISFLDNPRYRKYLASTRASGVILNRSNLEFCPVDALVVDNPYAAYAKVATLFQPQIEQEPGIHPTAVIPKTAKIHPSARIGAFCVIGNDTVIGANVYIHANSIIGEHSHIGDETVLWGRVTVYHGVHIGKRVIIHSGAVIGSDGFGFAKTREGWIKVPQLGGVIIEDEVEIGANTTIDRGALDNTIIGFGAKLDNQIQIAHNVKIGAYTAIAGCVGIAGSTIIGKHCLIGGGVGIAGHLTITDNVAVTGMTLVSHSISEPGVYSSGTGLQTNQEWKKSAVRLRQLDDLFRRVKQLEAIVDKQSTDK